MAAASLSSSTEDNRMSGSLEGPLPLGSIGKESEDDTGSINTNWTESTDVPRREMKFLQVFSMMVNQMIGSGIFNTPAYILLLTKSKQLSLVLWFLGGVYTFLSALVYLEYSTALPYNGGPVIWLDETFHRPQLFAAITFSIFWIVFATSGNSASFTAYVLQLTYPNLAVEDIDRRWFCFFQIVVQGLICLALYFARRLCFVFNNLFAIFKILLLITIAIGGFVLAGRQGGASDFTQQYPGFNGLDALSGMIYVIYSYEGWEYTNYIAGDIHTPKQTLRKAVFASIGLVTVLYMLVTSAYFTAMTYAEIQKPTNQFGLIQAFATKAFGNSKGANVGVAISTLSNAIAITYAQAKVKQAIAWQRFIPFASFFGKRSQFDSPGGALLLHWVVMTIYIIILPRGTESYTFSTGTFTYVYQALMVFLGIGLLRLKSRMRINNERWKATYLRNRYILWPIVAVFIGLNILTLVTTARPNKSGTVPRFWWAVEVAGIFAAGGIYWSIITLLRGRVGKTVGLQITVHQNEDENIPESLRGLMTQADLDGSNRRLTFKVSGPTEVLVRKYWNVHNVVYKVLG